MAGKDTLQPKRQEFVTVPKNISNQPTKTGSGVARLKNVVTGNTVAMNRKGAERLALSNPKMYQLV